VSHCHEVMLVPGLWPTSTYDGPVTASNPAHKLQVALLVVAWFNLVSALIGMVGLTVGGGLGLPPEWLERTAFSSYFWPGMFLGVIVGGVQALALIAQHGRFRAAW